MDKSATIEIVEQFGTRLAGQYLTFVLSGEEYCIELFKVQQIIQLESITRVPLSPKFILGVINLRGKVVPVVDLRIKFEMEVGERTEKTCMVVLQLNASGSPFTVAFIIDEVREVTKIKEEEIEEVPEFGASLDVSFLMGVAKINHSVRMLLDIDKLFSLQELNRLDSLQEM